MVQESETGGLLSEASLGLIVETLSQKEQKQLIVMAPAFIPITWEAESTGISCEFTWEPMCSIWQDLL